jgi:hypothetical protein
MAKKDKLFTMKLTEEELIKYKELAKGYGISLAQLVNLKLQDIPLPPPPKATKVDKDLIIQLAKIGNNLNQIARAVNSNQRIEILKELRVIESQMHELLNAH